MSSVQLNLLLAVTSDTHVFCKSTFPRDCYFSLPAGYCYFNFRYDIISWWPILLRCICLKWKKHNKEEACCLSLLKKGWGKYSFVITKFIKLYYHRIKYQLIRKISLTPVSYISLSSRRCHGDNVMMEMSPRPPFFLSVCLHPLLSDVIPYWGQVLPYSVSAEAWVQGSYIDGFLHPSFKPSGFSCQDFSVLQFHRMRRLFKVNVRW